MARDGFPKEVIDRLARRVGMKCSFPDCRQPTSGPDIQGGTTNVGVAAHISAASPGGPRYDACLTPDERGSFSNGIWLCQNHAKLIDSDEIAFPPSLLNDWKSIAEQMAGLEARGYVVSSAQPYSTMEKKVPSLVSEMRVDLVADPLVRQFILMHKGMSYNHGSTPLFTYYYDTHPQLDAMITIMAHYKAVYDSSFNNVPRYNFNEAFVDYVLEKG